MTTRTPEQHANLAALRALIESLPGEQYSANQLCDNLTPENLFTLPLSEWTGASCAFGHAIRSGRFPGLVVSPETLDCHKTVFGEDTEYLFGLNYLAADAPREGEPARLAMLENIDTLLREDRLEAA